MERVQIMKELEQKDLHILANVLRQREVARVGARRPLKSLLQ